MRECDAHVCEDKWLEFLATEPRFRAQLQRTETDVVCMRRVEVRGAYGWLLAAALVTWLVS